MNERVLETVNYIRSQIGQFQPDVLLVLGSGLGAVAECVQDKISIPYEQIPNFPTSRVVGHKGCLSFGKIYDKNVMIMEGRFHYYEGYTMPHIVLPIYVAHSLGTRTLFLTNAVGAINPNFNVGDLVITTDHINMTGNNPLIGYEYSSFGTQFPDLSHLYDAEISSTIESLAESLSIPVHRGVFVQTTGPSFETPAEIKFFSLIGADTVGMSSAVEAIAGKHCQMRVVCLSLVSNYASGVHNSQPNHNEVLDAGKNATASASALIIETVKRI